MKALRFHNVQAGWLELHSHITGYFRVCSHGHTQSIKQDLTWEPSCGNYLHACHSPLQQGSKMCKPKPPLQEQGASIALTSRQLMQFSVVSGLAAWPPVKLRQPNCFAVSFTSVLKDSFLLYSNAAAAWRQLIIWTWELWGSWQEI